MEHKHLPHINDLDYYQFITFRTHDSLDDYLDKSNNGSYLNDDVLDYLYNFIIEKDQELYNLVTFCIMPNHVHMLFIPLKPLSKVMQIIKGSSSNSINEIRQAKKSFGLITIMTR
jgi:REP element-mobilizing transposase RayT